MSNPPQLKGNPLTTERDELAEIIKTGLLNPIDGEFVTNTIATELIRLGYRKPRTVTTAEELDAAIIRAFEGGENLVLLEKGGWRPYILWEDDRGNLHVTSLPMEDDPERLTLGDIALPATVLHEGVR